jgi:1-pyrroline-5-carboxylate dehydrogenase
MFGPFRNEPLTDFSDPATKVEMEGALIEIAEQAFELGVIPLVIGGRKVKTKDTFTTVNPANPGHVLATFCKAGKKEAQAAIRAADKAFAEWAAEPAQRRAEVLLRAAEMMRERRFELNATMVLEVGKNWVEADADTAEAIDFLEYYAREALFWNQGMDVGYYPNECNETGYIPLGVVSVIPPWNFPCAILAGMATAAIVAGNTVCLKPASDAPLIGYKVAQILFDAGLPAGVLNFVPGPGSTCGEELVTNPRVRMIAFTGSREVGLGIIAKAAQMAPGQKWIKRVIAELGGKDTLIVDETADLDKAAISTAAAAFGFQGQKCSACSRVVVVASVYNRFKEKLLKQIAAITVGPVDDERNFMGPLVNAGSLKKWQTYVGLAKRQAKIVTGGNRVKIGKGYFVEPTLVENVKPGSRIDQEEVFAPLLALLKAKDFDHALELANGTDYGLTGGLISKSRANIERARREFMVGNLYINRKITGALVGVQPFGGFDMSGTCSKAGGSDYLGLFLQTKSYTERF